MKKFILSVSIILFLLIFRVDGQSLKPKYVVSPNGSDDNPGTEEKPFATIQKAADIAKAGDIVLIKAGRYYEHITFKNSGKPDKPIIFIGERGADGGWLSVVNPGTPISNWEPAPEIGQGVYKTTSTPFNPYCLVVDSKQLLKLSDRNMALDKGKLLPIEQLKKIKSALARLPEGVAGFNLLRLPPDAMVEDNRGERSFWEGIGAVYGHIDGVTYIRFCDGDDPNKKNISASPRGVAFLINNLSYITLKDLAVNGAEIAVTIKGEKSSNNIIDSCFLANGRKRVMLTDKASHNIIQNNRITLNYYGYIGKPLENIYKEFKHTQGLNTSDDDGVYIRLAGTGNIIRNNNIYDGLIGINISEVSGIQIYGNLVRDMSSIGICTSTGTENCFVHDNFLFRNAINLRIHLYNRKGINTDTRRREYYYRNFFYHLEKTEGYRSGHVFTHNDLTLPLKFKNPEEEPQIFFYHNTFAGGSAFSVIYYSTKYAEGDSFGMRRTVLLNNIFSFINRSTFTGYAKSWEAPADLFEVTDYNWIVITKELVGKKLPLWLGENNILSRAVYRWKPETLFSILKDSPFREKGLDLSKKFTINDKEYGPLPGMLTGYFKGKNPDLGALQYGEELNKWFLDELKEAGAFLEDSNSL